MGERWESESESANKWTTTKIATKLNRTKMFSMNFRCIRNIEAIPKYATENISIGFLVDNLITSLRLLPAIVDESQWYHTVEILTPSKSQSKYTIKTLHREKVMATTTTLIASICRCNNNCSNGAKSERDTSLH